MLFIRKIIFTFVLSVVIAAGRTFCESVFRKSFNENVEVFFIGKTSRNNTRLRVDYCDRAHSAAQYPISIRVWGIVSSISYRVFPQPSLRYTGTGSTLSLYIYLSIFGS